MPRNISFIKKNLNKIKKPLKKKVVPLNKIRDYRLIIRQGAVDRHQVVIVYKKITTGEVKRYTVCPMSYRYRRLRSGFRKVLFAKDVAEKQLKMFVLRNIKQAVETKKKYIKLSFPIEIT